MSSALPHLQQLDDRPLAEIASTLLNHDSDECYLAVSHGFWEVDEQDAFDEVFKQYALFFDKIVAKASELLGAPSYRGRWDSADFPEWAFGYEIAVWSNQMWVRLEHEDRECPIIIALSPFPA